MTRKAPTLELLDRQRPCDLDAERATIGACLIDGRKVPAVAEIVRPDDFHQSALAIIFRHMLQLDQPDPVAVVGRLRDAGDLNGTNVSAMLAELMASVPYAADAEYHAGIVAKKASFRRVIDAGEQLIRAGYDETKEPERLVEDAEQLLHATWGGTQSRAPKLAGTAMVNVISSIDAIRSGQRTAGLPTGLPAIDRAFGGLFPGELFVVAARPGIGKTALACQIALHSATHERPVYFVSLEMNSTQLLTRILCGQADVSSRRVRTGLIDQDETERLCSAAQTLAGAQLWIHDLSEMTVAEIRRTARRRHRDGGLRLIVVDYLQRLTPTDRRVNRDQQVGEMSTSLKALALGLDVPILLLCQLNRQSESDAAPKLSHLRESGSIEQDSDVVAFLQRVGAESDDPRQPIDVNFHCVKNRNGETGRVPLLWIPARTMFRGEDGWT